MKKIIYLALIAVIVGCISTSCEKENLSTKTNINTLSTDNNPESKKKPSLAELAAILGVSVDAIISVDYKSGSYHYRETEATAPNGTVIKTKDTWCSFAPWQFCMAIVRVKVETKGSNDLSCGYVGIRESNGKKSIIMIFDETEMYDPQWFNPQLLTIEHNLPLVNAHDIGLCNSNEGVYIPMGQYQLQEYESFKYVEIDCSKLIVENSVIIVE